MGTAIIALSIAGAISMLGTQSAGAVATHAAAMKEAARGASTVQQAQFYARATRHYIINATANSSSTRTCATASIVGDGS